MKITNLHSNHHYSSDPSHPSWWGDDDSVRDCYEPWEYRQIGHWMGGGDYWHPGMWSSQITSNTSIVDGSEIYVTVVQNIIAKHFKNRPKRKVKFRLPSAPRAQRPRLFAYGDSNLMKVWDEDGCL